MKHVQWCPVWKSRLSAGSADTIIVTTFSSAADPFVSVSGCVSGISPFGAHWNYFLQPQLINRLKIRYENATHAVGQEVSVCLARCCVYHLFVPNVLVHNATFIHCCLPFFTKLHHQSWLNWYCRFLMTMAIKLTGLSTLHLGCLTVPLSEGGGTVAVRNGSWKIHRSTSS